MVDHVQPDTLTEFPAPAPAVSDAALAPVVDCTAPAPAVETTHLLSHERILHHTVEQNVDVAPARVLEHLAPRPLDAYDAALMGILDDFHQAVKRLLEVPPHPSVVEHSASASSACSARPPVDDWNVQLRSSHRKKSSRQSPPPRRPRRANTSAEVNGVRDGNRLPGAV